MVSFQDWLQDSATHGGVNLVFESGMYSLVNDLDGIVRVLVDAGVIFEVVGVLP